MSTTESIPEKQITEKGGSGQDLQSVLMENFMEILYSLSFYSPIIVIISVILFSMFTGTLTKAFVFFLWIFVITFIRIIVFKSLGGNENDNMPKKCLTGVTQIFVPNDVTYSVYILTFTLMYFYMPMIMVSSQSHVNVVNYGVLAFFLSYIMLDLFIKSSLNCIPSFFSQIVIADLLGGFFLGGLIAGVFMYGSVLRRYLYINEINNNKEICSMPSKQQFKCQVYKNGELVGSSIN